MKITKFVNFTKTLSTNDACIYKFLVPVNNSVLVESTPQFIVVIAGCSPHPAGPNRFSGFSGEPVSVWGETAEAVRTSETPVSRPPQ